MSVTTKIVPVTDKKGKKDFLAVPFRAHRGDPNWVAPLFFERLEHLDPKKNPYFQHADVQLFVAYQNGEPVGRISAQNDLLRLKSQPDNKGMFGFLDAIDSAEVFSALTQTAADWLKSKGRSGMIGPFSFSINDETGLLIDGFDTPPNMMMGHAQPYYAKHLETLGFKKAKDVIAYFADRNSESTVMERIGQRALASGDYAVRSINLSDVKSEIRLIMGVFNDAWSQNWGFVPFTEAELDKLGADLKMMVNKSYGTVASYKGEVAAFAITLPNLNEWIRGMNGRLLPFNWLKLVGHILRKKPGSARMPLMGVRRKFHGTPVGTTLAALSIMPINKYHMERGMKSMELSWILEDNMPVRRIVESFGAKPYKTYRLYEKSL
jgi:hypothetical protein